MTTALNTRLIGGIIAVCVASTALRAGADWPLYRHDPRLTGATNAKGAIVRPKVLWEYYLGAPAIPHASTRQSPEGAFDLAGDGTFERLAPAGQTLHVQNLGGGELGAVTVEGRPLAGRPIAVKLFPKSRGKQVVLFSHRMDTGEGQGYCFTFDRGPAHGELAWTTGHLANQYSPTIVVDDVDGDGRPDVVNAPHYCVQIFDGLSGKAQAEIPWDVGRNYGFLGTGPRRPDGHKDIFIVCDFVPHVDCIRFEKGKWVHAWGHKYFDPNSAMPRGREIALRVGPHPIADLDGDGRVEMVYLINDAARDDRWHLRVRDGETGEVRLDLPGVWLWSVRDLDGDGRCELVYTPCAERRPPEYCDLHVATLVGKSLVDRGVLKNVRPVPTVVDLPPTADTIADEGRLDLVFTDVDRDGILELMVAERSAGGRSSDRFSAYEIAKAGTVKTAWDFRRPGHRLDLVRASPDGSGSFAAEIRDFDASTELTIDSRGQVLREADSGRPGGFSTTPIVVDLLGDGHPAVVLQDAAEQIEALRFTVGRKNPERLWRIPGVAMNGSPGVRRNGDLCVQSADVDGDGRPEVLFAAADEQGRYCLVCAERDGKVRWRHSFERCPWGGVQAGVNYWTFGRFSGGKKGCDVYVDFHRRSRISNEGGVLSGQDGRLLWGRQGLVAAETAMPFGGGIPAVADVNGDGADDLVSMFWTIFASVSGKTGDPLFPPAYLLGPKYFNHWFGYSWPTLADFDGDGKLDVYLNSREGSSGGYAAVTTDGKPLWSELHWFDKGPGGFGPVADLDGDGKLEIVIPVVDGTLLCLDAKTGKRRWSAPIGVQRDVIAADLDGDGRKELVFNGRDGKMWAVRGSDGQRLWSIEAPGRPIAADVDGDGLIELLAVGPDGVLRIVGNDR